MTVRGMAEAGSTDPTEVKDVLPGLEMPTIFGQNQFRDCDHQAMNPTWMGELVAGDGEMADVKLLSKVEGADALPPCEEMGCSL
jgi:branched-chain amino acid transport system substrate-binding protein